MRRNLSVWPVILEYTYVFHGVITLAVQPRFSQKQEGTQLMSHSNARN
jgi:hypothetical protein